MNRFNGKRVAPAEEPSTDLPERRRLGKVVHDERGMASIHWVDAPAGARRTVLELEDDRPSGRGDMKLRLGLESALTIQQEDSFNPYDRRPETFGGGVPAGRGRKKDLRKLSEWIKTVRAVEERKKNGE